MHNHNGTYSLTRCDICHTVGNPVVDTHDRASCDSHRSTPQADHHRGAALRRKTIDGSIICDLSGKHAVRQRRLG